MNEQPNNNQLALELLSEIKSQSKRWFVLAIVGWIVVLITNAAWLYAWNLPLSEETITYDVTSEDNGNSIINDAGEVNINDKSN